MAFQDTVRHYAKEFAKMGYAAYCFDFCGGSVLKKGKRDGTTTEMSVLTEVKDLEAVISYVQSLNYTSKALVLMAYSQGGFVLSGRCDGYGFRRKHDMIAIKYLKENL